LEDVQTGETAYAGRVDRAGVVAQSALRARGGWPSLVDGVVAGAVSAVVFGLWVASSPASGLAAAGMVCALTSATTVAWRSRAPEAAVIVAGAGAIGCEWLTGIPTLQHHDLVGGWRYCWPCTRPG
jgi:membrane protease YdiL (CAAX protease family)